MPFVTINGFRSFYRVDGEEGRPAVMLSHSLGLDHGLWDALTADLRPHALVVRYDTRGHGASDTPPGEYRIEQMGRDALAIADAIGLHTFAFCGLSLGGMIGQWLGAHAGDRLTALVLANTSARLTEPQLMEERRRRVLEQGLAAIADTVVARFFSPRRLAAGGPAVAWARRTLLATDPAGYAACCAAIRDLDQRALLSRIRVPTLVIGGNFDVSMPCTDHSRPLEAGIQGARSVRLPAGHVSNLERPRSFSAAVLEFLFPAAADLDSAGAAMRRQVLGDAHVDRAATGTTDLTREFQALLTRFAWGSIWTRPALDRRTRRLLVLTVTAAMGRWEEFRLHVRTGLADDLEPADLKEVLLQVAVYAGIPAANTAFQIADEALQST